jgi:hypothetical protein
MACCSSSMVRAAAFFSSALNAEALPSITPEDCTN